MKNQINKPITIIKEEVVNDIANVINNSMLPAFVIENILKDMYLEAKAMAQRQYEIDKERYEESLKSLAKGTKEKDVEEKDE